MRAGWPGEQTINVDRDGNVWISGTGRGDSILKFTRDGKLLKDFGHRPPAVPPGQTPPPLVENNQQTDVFISGVAGFDFDEDARELYVAETEFINKRILVFDMDTGAFKRGWGGKGVPLGDIPNERVAPCMTRQGRRPTSRSSTSCTASTCPTTASCMSAIAGTTGCRSSRSRAGSSASSGFTLDAGPRQRVRRTGQR